METLAWLGAVVGSAAFGAAGGKVLDFLIAPWADRFERKRWLRQTKVEAYSRLTEELLSLGMVSGAMQDPFKFRIICAKAILLIDDRHLIAEIEKIIQEVWQLTYNPSTVVNSNLPEDWTATLPDGSIASKKTWLRGAGIDAIEKEAFKIAEKLSRDLKKT